MPTVIPMTRTLTPHIHRYVQGRYRRGELSKASRENVAYSLHTLDLTFGRRPLSQLGPKAIDQWMETIADRGPSTRRNHLSRVRGFCRWLIQEGLIAKDPTAHVPRIRVQRTAPVTLSTHEVGQLLASAPDERARAILTLFYAVGARCCEISRVQAGDFDRHRRQIRLRGKGGHVRVVQMASADVAALVRYVDTVGIHAGPLFRSRTDPQSGLAAATISHYVREWMWASGVKRQAGDGRSAHALRRTYATELMEAYHDVQVVQHALGHARIETTARHYLADVPAATMAEAVEARAAMLRGDKAPQDAQVQALAKVLSLVPDNAVTEMVAALQGLAQAS